MARDWTQEEFGLTEKTPVLDIDALKRENKQLEERLKKTQDLELELRKENEQLKKWCEEFNTLNVSKENAKLKKQLAIAVEALSWYDGLEKILIGWEIATGQERGTAEKALCEIKELEK